MTDVVNMRKKASATVIARRADAPGTIDTERGPMDYVEGDWILTTRDEPVQSWPVSQEYLDANYEPVAHRQTVADVLDDLLEALRRDRAGLPMGEASRSLAVVITQLELVQGFAVLKGL